MPSSPMFTIWEVFPLLSSLLVACVLSLPKLLLVRRILTARTQISLFNNGLMLCLAVSGKKYHC